MNKSEKIEIVEKVNKTRKKLILALIDMETLTLHLAKELELEYPLLSSQLREMGISTVDNAIDDLCNGIGFLFEEMGFPIKGQM